jgi:predicted nucleic acid-binding protein
VAAKGPKIVLDASVLVAACVASHPEHAACRRWVQRAAKGEIHLVVAAHSLAETYAVLSSLPLSPRISPDLAARLVEQNVVSHAGSVVALSATEYRQALRRLAAGGFSGGVTYDMLVVAVADKARAAEIVTLNRRDFDRLAPGRARLP